VLSVIALITVTLSGTGAFSTVSADRNVSVSVADDADAFLGLEPTDDAKGVYATKLNGQIKLTFDGSGTSAEGLNPSARTSFGKVFVVTNQGTQSVNVSAEPANGTTAVEFYAQNSGNRVQLNTSGVVLDPGEQKPVSVVIKSGDGTNVEAVDKVRISAVATQGEGENAPESGDPGDSNGSDTDPTNPDPPGGGDSNETSPSDGSTSDLVRATGQATTGETVTIDTSDTETPASGTPSVNAVSITYAENTEYNTTVQTADDPPQDTAASPDGTVLSYINVSHPETPNSVIENATFDINVPNSAGNGTGKIGIVRYNETMGSWRASRTSLSYVEQTPDGVHYEAETDKLSQFAVVELLGAAYIRTTETQVPIENETRRNNASLLLSTEDSYPAGVYETYREESFNATNWNKDAAQDADVAAALIRERLRAEVETEDVVNKLIDYALKYLPTPYAVVDKIVSSLAAIIDANEFLTNYGSGIQKQAVAIHVDPGTESYDELRSNLEQLEQNTYDLKEADVDEREQLLDERETLLKETYLLLPEYTNDVHNDVIGDAAGIEDPQSYHIIRSDLESLRAQLLLDYQETTSNLYGASKKSLASDTSMPTHGWTTEYESVVYDTMDYGNDFVVAKINAGNADDVRVEVAGANVDDMDAAVVMDRPDAPRFVDGTPLTGDSTELDRTVSPDSSVYVVVRADETTGPVRISTDAAYSLSVSERAGPDIHRPVANLIEGPDPVTVGEENTVYPTNNSNAQLTWELWDAKTPTNEIEYRFRSDTGSGFTDWTNWDTPPEDGQVSPELSYQDGVTRVQLQVRDNAERTAVRNADVVVSENAPQTIVEAPENPDSGDIYVKVLPERRIKSVELQYRQVGNKTWEDWQVLSDTEGFNPLTAPETGDIEVRARASGLTGDFGKWDSTSLTYAPPDPPDTTKPTIELVNAPSRGETRIDGEVETRRVTNSSTEIIKWEVSDDRTDAANLSYRIQTDSSELPDWKQTDGSQIQTSTDVSTNGTTLDLFVRDAAGNINSANVELRRDKTAPTVTVDAKNDTTGGVVSTTANEPVSAVELQYRQTSESSWSNWRSLGNTGEQAISLEATGKIEVRARGVDAAGNVGGWTAPAKFYSLPEARSTPITDRVDYSSSGKDGDTPSQNSTVDVDLGDISEGVLAYNAIVDEIDGELFIDVYMESRDGNELQISSITLDEERNQTIREDLPPELADDNELRIEIRGNGTVVLESLRAIGAKPSVPPLQVNQTDPLRDETVEFTLDADWPGSTYVDEYRWDFDSDGKIDENTSQPVAETTYANAGERNATVTVVDIFGATGASTTTINVNAMPEPSIDTSRTALTDESVALNASGSIDPDGEIVEYEWRVGNGSFETTGEKTTVSFPDDDTYPVTLRVTDNNGQIETASTTITIENRPPIATASLLTDQAAVDEEVEFDAAASNDLDGTISAFEWDLDGDGSFDQTGSSTRATFNDYGWNNITLRVSDDDGATNQTEVQFYVNAPPEPDIADPTPGPVYTGEEIEFDATKTEDPDGQITSYAWMYNRTAGGQPGRPSRKNISFDQDGNYSVTLQVTDNNGTTRSTSENVTVLNRPPEPSLSVSNRTITVSESISVNTSASDSDGTVKNKTIQLLDPENRTVRTSDTNLTESVNQSGNWTVIATATDDDGATARIMRSVEVNSPPTADIEAVGDPTVGETFRLQAVANDSDGSVQEYSWQINGTQYKTAFDETVEFNPDTSGQLPVSLRVTDDDGAVTVTNQTFDVRQSASVELYPQLKVGNHILSVYADPINIPYANSTVRWDLTGDGKYETEGGFSIERPINQTGTYEIGVRVESPNGTAANNRIEVDVNQLSNDVDIEWATDTDLRRGESGDVIVDDQRIYTVSGGESTQSESGGGLIEARNKSDGSVEWQVQTDVPVYDVKLSNQQLYAVGRGIVAVEAATGDVEWKREAERYTEIAANEDEGLITVTSGKTISGFSIRNGTQMWESTEDDYIREMQLADEIVVYEIDDQIVAKSSADGSVMWKKSSDTVVDADLSEVNSELVIYGINEYSDDAKVAAVDTATGEIQWTRSINDLRGYDIYIEETVLSGSNTHLLMNNYTDTYIATIEADGTRRFERTIPDVEAQEMTVVSGRMFIAGESYAESIDTQNGEEIWQINQEFGFTSAIKKSDDGVVIVGEQTAAIIDSTAGNVIWSVNDLQTELPAYDNGIFYRVSGSRVYAIQANLAIESEGSSSSILKQSLPDPESFIGSGTRSSYTRATGTVRINTSDGKLFLNGPGNNKITSIGGYLLADNLTETDSWGKEVENDIKLIGTSATFRGDGLSFEADSFRGIALRAVRGIDLVIDGETVAENVSTVRYDISRGVFEQQGV
jgi:PGF-pre-PGF domain-containing protein